MPQKKINDDFNIIIALYRPEIPANTGNIGRLCVGLNIPLHIVSKPSFIISSKEVKRAGLDYWENLQLVKHENENTFLEYCNNNNKRIVPITKFGKHRYDEFQYSNNDTALHYAAMYASSDVIKNIVASDKSSVNMANNENMYPIHYAALENNVDALVVLVQKGRARTQFEAG